MLTQAELLEQVNSTTTDPEATATDDSAVVVTSETPEETAPLEATVETTEATPGEPVTEEATADGTTAGDDTMSDADLIATSFLVDDGTQAETTAEDGIVSNPELMTMTSVVDDGTEADTTPEDGTIMENDPIATTSIPEAGTEGEATPEDGIIVQGDLVTIAEDGTIMENNPISMTSVVDDGTETNAPTEEGTDEVTAEADSLTDGDPIATTSIPKEDTEDDAIAEESPVTEGEQMVQTTAVTEEEEIAETIQEVEESGLFDEAHYLSDNPGVLEAVMRGETTAIRHFAQFGIKEQRSCNAFIDFKGYVENNEDIKEAVEAGEITPFGHFVRHGQFEKRVAHALFKAEEYEAFNADVQQAVAEGKITAWGHFLQFGWKENRQFSSFFNAEYYLQQNTDVAEAVAAGQITATEHLFKFGLKEKRKIHPLIDLKVLAEANSENIQSFFNVSELSAVSGFELISYAINVAFVQGLQTSESFSFSSLESIFGSQLTSIFSVSSFSEISIEQLFAFFGSAEGQELLGSAGGDDLSEGSGDNLSGSGDDLDEGSGDDLDEGSGGLEGGSEDLDEEEEGDDAEDGSDPQIVFDNPNFVSSGNNSNNPPDETPEEPTGETPEEPTGETPEEPTGETPEDPTSLPPAPTALFNLQYVVKNNLEALQAKFTGFDFNNLTAEQAEQIKEYAAAEGLDPSPFVKLSYFESAVKTQVETKLLEQGMTEEEISSLTSEELLEKALELGFSPTPLIDLSYCKSVNSTELTELGTKLGVDISTLSNQELFELIVKEGIEAGLNPSPFFSVGYIKKLYIESIREFYSVASITELETPEVLDNVFSSGEFVIDLKYYRTTYTVELDAYAKELLGDEAATGEDLSDDQVKAYACNEGKDAGLQTSPFDIEGFSVQYEVELKAFYSVESVETLSQHEIYSFMVTEAIAQGLEVSEYIDVSYYQSTFEAALVATFELTAITEITAEQVVSFLFGDAAPFVDTDYFKLKYGEQVTADGKAVKDLSGKELQFYIFSEGWEAGYTSLSAFNLEAITADATISSQLLTFYGVATIEEVTSAQIVSYMTEGAWKMGIDLSAFVAAEDIELYRDQNAALLAEYYGIELTEVETLNSELVLDFQFGCATEVADIEYIRATLGEEILAAVTAQGATITDVSQLTKLQIVEYLYAQESLETVKLSAFDVAGYVEANGEAIANALGIEVDKLSEIDSKQIEKFMLKEGVALGLTLDGFVETTYIKEAYGLAIAESLSITVEEVAALDSAAVLNWVSSDFSKLDVNFLAYQFEQLTEAQQTELLTGLEITLTEGASLSVEQVLQVAYSEEFKAVLAVEELKLSAIDITAYVTDNTEALTAFYGGESKPVKVKSGSFKLGKSGSFGSLKSMSGSAKFKSGSIKLKSGSLKLSGALDEGGEFDVNSLSDKQIIKFALTEGLKQGIDLTKYVDVDYLKQEFSVDLARHYNIEVSTVVDLKQELVLDYLYGGLSSEIDFEFIETQYAAEIAGQFGVTADQITDAQILEFAYGKFASTEDFSLTPVDVEGFVEQYGTKLLEIAGAAATSGVFSKSDIVSFMFNEASELGIDITPFVEMDYYTEKFSDKILANYSLENVFNISGEQVYDFMTTEGITQGFNTSAVIDLEWYKTEYATVLEQDKAQIDVDANGEISNDEAFDYITGAGLEKGQNPSELVNFESYLAEGSASAQALLAWAGATSGATSLEQVSYSQILQYMFSAGLEAGLAPSAGLDVNALKTQNAEALIQFYSASSITEVTNVQAFNYAYGSGFQQPEEPAVV
ncbi:hypothetical protein NG796_22535 [Laspinema sp. A4]|uniref:hypothetical protein n=1 Tax=Laspinema sp. D2d TaxID=2953686 RepID=UPI0021BB7EE6|nr:hypothetical protein [Laspinema sp. D2d]MCT7986058.1 hypothetical protein [Laspinema sp. D2d]